MAYFINVGRFAGLKGGMGARGWHIWRRYKVIHIEWGAIDVHNRYPKRFVWAGKPTHMAISERTVKLALKRKQQRIKEKTGERRANSDKPYQRLPPGQKILKEYRRK